MQPGTILKKLIEKFIGSQRCYKCSRFAKLMDQKGWLWCLQHQHLIIERVKREAIRRGKKEIDLIGISKDLDTLLKENL